MAFVAVEAQLDEGNTRQARRDLLEALGLIGLEHDRACHIVAVAWEIWTNAQRFASGSRTTVLIDEKGLSITLRTIGQRFDSVQASSNAGARGLRTAAWRVARAGCTWHHRYAEGRNEIRIDYGG